MTLVNPESLMAPGAPSTSAQANIVTENIAVDPLEETPDFSVPPPNYFPKEKSTEELEYEKKVAAFLQRNIAKKDDLDDKIDKHLDGGKPGRKRRKFTDYPEPSSSSGQVQKQPETRTVKKLSPSKDSGIVYDSVIGKTSYKITSKQFIWVCYFLCNSTFQFWELSCTLLGIFACTPLCLWHSLLGIFQLFLK